MLTLCNKYYGLMGMTISNPKRFFSLCAIYSVCAGFYTFNVLRRMNV